MEETSDGQLPRSSSKAPRHRRFTWRLAAGGWRRAAVVHRAGGRRPVETLVNANVRASGVVRSPPLSLPLPRPPRRDPHI